MNLHINLAKLYLIIIRDFCLIGIVMRFSILLFLYSIFLPKFDEKYNKLYFCIPKYIGTVLKFSDLNERLIEYLFD